MNPPQILDFLHIGIMQLISEPKGKDMNLQFFPKKFQSERWGGKGGGCIERTVTERETEDIETASPASGIRALGEAAHFLAAYL